MGGGITQDELDRLFTAALETALALLAQRDEFFPALFELRADRSIQTVAVLDKDASGDPVDAYGAVLRPRAAEGTILASAIASVERDLAAKGGTIRVRLRAANYASDMLARYTIATSGVMRRERKVELGPIAAEPAVNDVFGGA